MTSGGGRVCAITGVDTSKRSALLFDEIVLCVPGLAEYVMPRELKSMEICDAVLEADCKDFGRLLWAVDKAWGEKGIVCVPVCGTTVPLERHLGSGEQYVYQASIENIPVVAEHRLTWDQVRELREDEEARWKYAAFRQWARSGVAAKSVSEAVDSVGTLLTDYEWAIRKHGLETVVGSVKLLLHPKSLARLASAAGAGVLVGGPVWASLAAGLMVAGQVSVHVAERLIDLESVKRTRSPEVALLYDIVHKL